MTQEPDAPSFCYSLAGGRTLELDRRRPRVMGIVNITPDSFSDGGHWLEPERAVEHSLRLLEEGADLLDLGAESTRPGGGVYGSGALDVTAEEELARLQPVLERLRPLTDRPISVDTRKPNVAQRALELGADLINDVSGLADPEMRRVIAAHDCPAVLMHSRGELATMQSNIRYRDVVSEVTSELNGAARRATESGISRLILDPGIGFGKAFEHNLELVAGLGRIGQLGYPVLLGTSRKGYLGALTGRQPEERIAAGLATIARALGAVDILRVHDVAPTMDFLTVWAAHDTPREAFSRRTFPDGPPA